MRKYHKNTDKNDSFIFYVKIIMLKCDTTTFYCENYEVKTWNYHAIS